MKADFVFKQFFLIALAFLLIFVSSCDNEELQAPSSITVSQGDYMGVVHLTWTPIANAQHYSVQRDDGSGNWLDAGYVASPPFDDYGLGIGDNQLEMGKHYRYRLAAHTNDDDYDDSSYGAISEDGWTFTPLDLKTDITTKEEYNQPYQTINWTDTNLVLAKNVHRCNYVLYAKKANESTYSELTHKDFEVYQGELPDYHFSYDNGIDYAGQIIDYKIETKYSYRYKNMDNENWNGQIPDPFITNFSSNDNGNSLAYTWTPLSDFGSASNGIGFLETKLYNGVLYAAYLNSPTFGQPQVTQYSGGSWADLSNTLPTGLQNNFDKFSFAMNAQDLFIAGISDSLYVYRKQNSWSGNLAQSNMSYSAKPQDVSIEFFDNKLFAAVFTNDNQLEVKTWNHDTVWDSQASIEQNSGINNVQLKIINSKLYLYYRILNSGSNSTLKIKHLEGTNWVDDLEWSRDNISGIDITANASGQLYFSSNSLDFSWYGNVYKVTSNSNAEELLNTNDEITFPKKITFNSDGELLVLYSKINSDASSVIPQLAVYNGNSWSKISGDYAKGIFPASIESMNQSLYFIYGDAQNQSNGWPNSFKLSELTKN